MSDRISQPLKAFVDFVGCFVSSVGLAKIPLQPPIDSLRICHRDLKPENFLISKKCAIQDTEGRCEMEPGDI